MKRADARQAYYDYSAKASDIARTLGLSAIAIIWVLKVDGPNGPTIARPLVVAGFFAVTALTCDLLHYIAGTGLWGWFHRSKETAKDVDETTEFEAPDWINRPTLTLFTLKLVFTVVTYALLLTHLATIIAAA